MKVKKINLSAVLSAVGTGGSFELLMQGASKRVDFVNQNYLTVKSLSAGVVGSGLLYFGKSDQQKAAGYALLGIAGASGASKMSTVLVTSEEPAQGLPKLARLRGMIQQRRSAPAIERMKRLTSRPATMATAAPGRPGMSMPEPAGPDYAGLAFSDMIYNV